MVFLAMKKLKEWIAAINRKDFSPKPYSKVCSIHFIDGKPTAINPTPAIHLGYPKQVQSGRRPLIRTAVQPPKKRKTSNENNLLDESEDTSLQSPQDLHGPIVQRVKTADATTQCDDLQEVVKTADVAIQCEDSSMCNIKVNKTHVRDNGTQTNAKKSENKRVQACLPELSYEALSNQKVVFYTGLSKTIVDALILTMASVGILVKCKLSVPDQLLLVLMRLRLGLFLEDVADRFHISTWQASKLYKAWIYALKLKIGTTVCWLPKATIEACMPQKCKDQQPRTTCVIDCSEIFMQRPRQLRARAQTYSQYKSHNTVKFLVAIAPHGYVMYLSPCYGGRASDKFITMDSGFLDMLRPGDEVMADRGFKIETELAMRGVTKHSQFYRWKTTAL